MYHFFGGSKLLQKKSAAKKIWPIYQLGRFHDRSRFRKNDDGTPIFFRPEFFCPGLFLLVFGLLMFGIIS